MKVFIVSCSSLFIAQCMNIICEVVFATAGPGPGRYKLPACVGHSGHDPTRKTMPAFSFGKRLEDSSKLMHATMIISVQSRHFKYKHHYYTITVFNYYTLAAWILCFMMEIHNFCHCMVTKQNNVNIIL